MTLEEMAQALLVAREPCVMLVQPDGFAVSRPNLFGEHPVDILADLPDGSGVGWHAVGILTHATARKLDEDGEPFAVTVAAVITRDACAAVVLTPDGITTTTADEGAIVDGARAFLAGGGALAILTAAGL